MTNHKPYSDEQHREGFKRVFCKLRDDNKLFTVAITPKMLKEAEIFCRQIIPQKQKEKLHKNDNKHEWKRWMTGALGEAALEKFLNMNFCDRTIGKSKDYAVPDLEPINLKIGVKSFRLGNFPLINRAWNKNGIYKQQDGQVFVGISKDRKTAYIMGVAFHNHIIENQNKSYNDKFVKDANVLKRKTAFTDLQQIHQFQSYKELEMLAKKYNKYIETTNKKVS